MARVVFFLIGLLLSVTAFLKLWMLLTDPFADISAQMPRILIWIAFLIELFTVVVLVSKTAVEAKWIVTLIVFAGFWSFSLIRLLLGYTSCGCTGNIDLPPWASLILNNTIVVVLMLCRPNIQTLGQVLAKYSNPFRSGLNWGRVSAVGVAILLLAAAQLPAISSRLGMVPNVSGMVVDLPRQLDVGRAVEVHATLHNRLDQPVMILGFSKSCTCITDSGTAPRLILPASKVEFSIRITPHKPGRFRQRVICYVNVPGQNSVPLELSSFVFLP